MTRPAYYLSDETLTAALALARIRRETDSRLSARLLVAELELEQLERSWAQSPETAR